MSFVACLPPYPSPTAAPPMTMMSTGSLSSRSTSRRNTSSSSGRYLSKMLPQRRAQGLLANVHQEMPLASRAGSGRPRQLPFVLAARLLEEGRHRSPPISEVSNVLLQLGHVRHVRGELHQHPELWPQLLALRVLLQRHPVEQARILGDDDRQDLQQRPIPLRRAQRQEERFFKRSMDDRPVRQQWCSVRDQRFLHLSIHVVARRPGKRLGGTEQVDELLHGGGGGAWSPP